LELTISTLIDVTQATTGASVLDAGMIRDIAAVAASSELTIEPDIAAPDGKQRFLIRCGRARFDIASFVGVDEFPVPGDEKSGGTKRLAATVPAGVLATMIEHVAYAAAKDDNRRVLRGVHVCIDNDGDLLRMTATNAYRLATVSVAKEPVGGAVIQTTGSGGQIVPAVALEVFRRALRDMAPEESVGLEVGDKFATLKLGRDTYKVRLFDGHYPNWRQIIPQTFEAVLIANLSECLLAIRQAGAMADEDSKLVMELGPDKTIFRSSLQGVGSAESEIPASTGGKKLTVTCRGEYITDILKHMPSGTDEVTIQFAGEVKPILIDYQVEANEIPMSVKALIMPFNVAR
jgi:DNA polymerase-3 subunit beta